MHAFKVSSDMLDVPAFDWPIAPFPQARYPPESYQVWNDSEERRCIEEFRQVSRQRSEPRNLTMPVVLPTSLSRASRIAEE